MRMNEKIPEELFDLIEDYLMKIPRNNGVRVLDDTIFDISRKYQKYLEKENVNIHVKRDFEKRIADLIYVHDRLHELTLYDLWKRIEDIIIRTEKVDKNIDGFHIIIRRKLYGENFALIDLSN
jgi:hypothetical protein